MATLYLAGSAAIQWDAMDTLGVIKNRIDFSKNNAASSDVVQALNIPAGVGVLNVFVKVVTPVGGTCTATVGDGAGANSWDASTNLNATAGTITQGVVGTDAYCVANLGKLYTSADTIDLVMGNAATAGVCDVYALCYQLK